MINKLTAFLAIAFFSVAIFCSSPMALANTANTVDSTQQAAKKVTQDTGAKQQFGKSANGDKLLDNAQNKAGEKLGNLAEKAKSKENLPDSKKLFLDNLKAE